MGDTVAILVFIHIIVDTIWPTKTFLKYVNINISYITDKMDSYKDWLVNKSVA